ncbi:MAG TPA: sialate O-acetylesterase [Sphingobacteriaceae bacterium]|nr:sialate O-acetylesterase [Sphingobacteriaceae bacterium]
MRGHSKYVIILSLICFPIIVKAQTDPDFHLYLLAGQSNMAGRGEVMGKYKNESNARVYMLDKSNKWVPAKHPLHFDKPAVTGVGPGLTFGIQMAKTNPAIKIGLVPCAVGGTSINAWTAGGYDESTKTHPYDDAVKRIHQAMKSGVFKGIIWHQGESDSNTKVTETYITTLSRLITDFRDVIRDPELPFVAGQLGTYKDQYAGINRVLLTLPAQLKNTAVASSKGLKHKGDLTHFDSPSAEKLGKRYSKKMKRLQRVKNLK